MGALGISFTSFSIATFLLCGLHRLMRWRGRRTLWIFVVYPIGAFILGGVAPSQAPALVLYVLLSLLSFIWLITPVLGDVAPTSRIIAFLRDNPGASYQSIVQLFRDSDMVEKRLYDVARAGLLEKNGRYRATAAGRLIAQGIMFYLALISWEPSA